MKSVSNISSSQNNLAAEKFRKRKVTLIEKDEEEKEADDQSSSSGKVVKLEEEVCADIDRDVTVENKCSIELEIAREDNQNIEVLTSIATDESSLVAVEEQLLQDLPPEDVEIIEEVAEEALKLLPVRFGKDTDESLLKEAKDMVKLKLKEKESMLIDTYKSIVVDNVKLHEQGWKSR
jgi:hypothetical protein